MRVINLAHGGFALLGGALMHGLTFQLGWPFALALPVSVLSVTLIALPMEYVFFRPLYGKGDLTQVLATIGLTFLMIAFVTGFMALLYWVFRCRHPCAARWIWGCARCLHSGSR